MVTERNTASLSREDFKRLSAFIYQKSGIKMPDSKKVMVEARLRKRLRELNINSYNEYCNLIFAGEGSNVEITHMVDVITTNKTDFFREARQFDFLAEKAMPELVSAFGAGVKQPFKVWSAGCSTGEEPYTLAMVMSEFKETYPDFGFEIFATDISTRVLEAARLGIFDTEKTKPVRPSLLKKYFLRSKDHTKNLVRAVPELRSAIRFAWLNFMDDDFGIRDQFDVIFCRNVIIYFDRPTQEKLIKKLLKYLRPGGFLFLGHSESVFNMDVHLEQLAPSTYQKIK